MVKDFGKSLLWSRFFGAASRVLTFAEIGGW